MHLSKNDFLPSCIFRESSKKPCYKGFAGFSLPSKLVSGVSSYNAKIPNTLGAYYFLTKRKASVNAEIALSFLAYNLKRVMNILEIRELVRRLQEKRQPVLA